MRAWEHRCSNARPERLPAAADAPAAPQTRLDIEFGRVVGKEDDQIGRRKHQLSRWAPGERQVDEMRIRIAPSTPPGEYGLSIAVLRPDNETHVAITSRPVRTTLWGEDAVLVGTVEVTPA